MGPHRDICVMFVPTQAFLKSSNRQFDGVVARCDAEGSLYTLCLYGGEIPVFWQC